MSCGRMENKVLGYLDGRLKDSERLEMEKHLELCAACRLRVHEFRVVSGLLDELPMITPSPAFDARVHALVAAEPAKQSWWAWMIPAPRVALAASMLLLGTLWIGMRTPGVSGPQIDAADAPVLENYDVISNFEPLTDLPQPVQAEESNQ
jgi:anti-sigma factor RsiW